MQNKDWINAKMLRAEFGIAESTQAKYRRMKKIPYSKIGGFIFYSRAKIYAWLELHTFETEGVLR
jgi:hypothetical protein